MEKDNSGNRWVEVKLRRSFTFNGNSIRKAFIDLKHINHGVDPKTGDLKKSKRSNFSVGDIEKFLMMLDEEYLHAAKHFKKVSRFKIKIDCPVQGRFYQKPFIMIFETNYDKPEQIQTITLFPGW